MITEEKFKKILIKKLNVLNPGWRDGDKDNFVGKKADIVNEDIKVVIEIKDDTVFKMGLPSNSVYVSTKEVNLKQKGRQLKEDIKDANKKFINYPGYKSIVLLRTELVAGIIKCAVNGPERRRRINGQLISAGYPSTFFGSHDKSTKEVGVLIIYEERQGEKIFYTYIKNQNPNVNKQRIIEKEELKKILLRNS